MKNRRFTRFLSILLALLFLMSFIGCKNEAEEIPDNMQLATLAGSVYRLYIPIDWNPMTETGVSGGYASMTQTASVTVHSYENPDNLSLASYLETVYLPSLANVFPESDGISADETQTASLGGEEGISVTYEGTRNLVTYQCFDVLCIHEGAVYALSCVAQQDVFDATKEDFSAIWNAFVFSDTPYIPGTAQNTVPTDAEAPAGMKLASNDDVAYRFYVPENWCLDTARPTSSVYFSEEDRTNVSVTVYMPPESQLSAEEYWEQCKEELSAVYEGISYSDVITETELDGRPARSYRYNIAMDGQTYFFIQTIAAYRGMVYTLTYTADEAHADAHMDDYFAMLEAFDFRGND